MEKIKMTTPLVEMDGDEMTRILWKMIKDELLTPFIDLKTDYYDLGLEYRNDHSKCSTCQRVQFKRNVEESERNDPCNLRWNSFPCTDRCKRN